jgi:hypothetical protein
LDPLLFSLYPSPNFYLPLSIILLHFNEEWDRELGGEELREKRRGTKDWSWQEKPAKTRKKGKSSVNILKTSLNNLKNWWTQTTNIWKYKKKNCKRIPWLKVMHIACFLFSLSWEVTRKKNLLEQEKPSGDKNADFKTLLFYKVHGEVAVKIIYCFWLLIKLF